MLAHPVRTIVWGVTWRWSILFLSLIAPAPPAATIGVAVLLGIGLVASIWRRADLLGSTWRILLAVTIVNLGFWLGSRLLVPAITLAIIATLGDLWWSIAGPALERGRADRVATAVPAEVAVSAVAPNEPYLPVPRPAPILTLAPLALPERVDESRRRRASRGRMPAGVRLLIAACIMTAFFVAAAPTIASRASQSLSAAIASVGQRLNPITAAAPAVSSTPLPATAQSTPAPTPSPGIAVAPNRSGDQQSTEPAPAVDVQGICVSLPDGRYEFRLPNGQVIVVTTRHRSGCPDLASILKALQNAGGNSD
ncbi:MAG TPA: hypothetical protein VIO62_08605 [Candidatus Dormibacteraeota bacterium]|jgi:hypothetical protein